LRLGLKANDSITQSNCLKISLSLN